MKKVVHKQEENYDDLLREKLKHWRDKVGEMQTIEKIIKYKIFLEPIKRKKI